MAGNKNSGRKGFGEELANLKEEIKRMTLEELAKDKVFNHLKMTRDEDRQGIKEIALPVYLKSQKEKVEHSGNIVEGFRMYDNNNKTDNQTEDSLGDAPEQKD